MTKPPEVMAGLRLDEPFFDTVVKLAGGFRLTDQYCPPKDTRNADYLLAGWAIELKVLMVDPLEAAARQEKLRRFIHNEFPNPLFVGATKRQVRLSKEQERKYWVEIMGTPIQRALHDAEEQIVATRSFVPGALPSAVILVNSNVTSWGWSGFVNLVATYLESRPAIDVVIVMEGLPEDSQSRADYSLCVAVCARPETPPATQLVSHILNSMAVEIERRTGRAPSLVHRDGLGTNTKMTFSFRSDGNLFLKKTPPAAPAQVKPS